MSTLISSISSYLLLHFCINVPLKNVVNTHYSELRLLIYSNRLMISISRTKFDSCLRQFLSNFTIQFTRSYHRVLLISVTSLSSRSENDIEQFPPAFTACHRHKMSSAQKNNNIIDTYRWLTNSEIRGRTATQQHLNKIYWWMSKNADGMCGVRWVVIFNSAPPTEQEKVEHTLNNAATRPCCYASPRLVECVEVITG